ncbi:hypothetical protein LP421_14185 [Rhizobium sp. RCAM05350]|nr:hypothetical protein LP421_14185 [Rhizobium sp. RCAM05350]
MAITTSDTKTSSYAKVNDAYLKLTGLKWESIRGKKLTSDGAAIDNPAHDRRHRLLAEVGSYELEEVDLVYADGTDHTDADLGAENRGRWCLLRCRGYRRRIGACQAAARNRERLAGIGTDRRPVGPAEPGLFRRGRRQNRSRAAC